MNRGALYLISGMSGICATFIVGHLVWWWLAILIGCVVGVFIAVTLDEED